MIKYIILILLGAPRVLYSEIVLLIMNANKKKYPLEKRYAIVRNTVKWINFLLRAKININKNNFKLNENEGRLFVSNHRNIFEILAFIELSKKPLLFISKKENIKIPFLNTHLIACDALIIDRTSKFESLQVCKDASKLLKSGFDVVLFAEGTRSKDGKIHEFKAALPLITGLAKTKSYFITVYKTENAFKFHLFYPIENVYIYMFDPLDFNYYLENKQNYNELTRNMLIEKLNEFERNVK